MFVCVHVHMCVSVCGQRRGTWRGGEGRGAVLLERSAGPSQGSLKALARVFWLQNSGDPRRMFTAALVITARK